MSSITGLSSVEAEEYIKNFGRNLIESKKSNALKKILLWIISPVSLMLLATAFLSLYLGKTSDFWIILVLFFSNLAISVWHEWKTDKSIERLQKRLAVKVAVLRDNKWQNVDSTALALNDIVQLKVGDVVPADLKIINGRNISINESALTGESLPKQKEIGDTVYSGSFATTGEAIALVTATGQNTFFGKTIISVEKTTRRSALEKDIFAISKFISAVSIIVVVILTLILLYFRTPWSELAVLDLSLLIAGVPVALPTVMSLIISIGVFELSKKNVVVRRLASLEDLADVNLLMSDKTGTLTENKIQVEKIVTFGGYSEKEVIIFALSAAADFENNPLDKAVALKAKEFGGAGLKQIDYIPGDSERKRSTAIVTGENGDKMAISLGASQVIASLSQIDALTKKKFDKAVVEAANSGYRALTVSVNETGVEEKNMAIAGILFLADRLRSDAKNTIQFMNQNGIAVKIVTGDNVEISKKIAGELAIQGKMHRRNILDDEEALKINFSEAAGFCEVLPKDKFNLVKFARGIYTVAVTGDGINDLPAIKEADVGFAVRNSVDALKSSADIVLLSTGIAVIKDAIIEARKVFTRLYNYSLYRISESFRIVITIAVIGIIYKTYPLTPVQLIVLAFLNDIPIISLAFDKVKTTFQPSRIDAKERFTLGALFGLVGVANSLLLLFIMIHILHLSWLEIQTMFFLKLTVSGHMLIYVAHTRERWFRFLPDKRIIYATTITQGLATLFAFFGIFTASVSLPLIILVWVWSFFWMQVGEMMKDVKQKLLAEHDNKLPVKSVS